MNISNNTEKICSICKDKVKTLWSVTGTDHMFCTKCIIPHAYSYFGWSHWRIVKRKLIGWYRNVKGIFK